MLPVFGSARSGILSTMVVLITTSGLAQEQVVTPQVHAQRANEFLKANQPAKAIPEFTAIVAAQPNNVDAQANLGVLLYFQREFGAAEEHLRKAVQLNASLSKIQALLGLCEYQLGHLEAARGDLGAALPNLNEAK